MSMCRAGLQALPWTRHRLLPHGGSCSAAGRTHHAPPCMRTHHPAMGSPAGCCAGLYGWDITFDVFYMCVWGAFLALNVLGLDLVGIILSGKAAGCERDPGDCVCACALHPRVSPCPVDFPLPWDPVDCTRLRAWSEHPRCSCEGSCCHQLRGQLLLPPGGSVLPADAGATPGQARLRQPQGARPRPLTAPPRSLLPALQAPSACSSSSRWPCHPQCAAS